MPQRALIPTIGTALGSWLDVANALGYNVDGYGAYNTGSGYASLRNMNGRNDISFRDGIVGFEIAVRARQRASLLVNDSFTDTASTRLDQHDGELNADWQRPFTGADPSYQRINSSGRTYYAYENGSGYTTNGSEHFLTNYVPPSADYYVEARIYSASDGGSGEYAEIYARAATPYTFYVLQYDEGTNTWRLGYWNSGSRTPGQMTSLGTYAGDTITPGTSRLARLQVQGTSIKAFIDGVERMSATSNHITAAGYPGCRLDPGSSRSSSVIVTALIDLGSAQTVDRIKKRIGWVDNSQIELILEASNDGVNWVNAYTGPPMVSVPGTGSFQWIGCYDVNANITATPYRYWRTYVIDPSVVPAAEPRIGDFRLYVGGVEATYTEKRFGHRAGSTPHNWPEGTATELFTDVAHCDNTTSVGGTLGSDPNADQGLQFDTFQVGGIASASLNVYLSANGTTPRGNAKNISLTPTFADYLVGGPNDLLGASWSVADVRNENFGLLLERGSVSSEVEVDAIRVIIYFNSYGGPLNMLREQVRQQILIGRESGTNEVQTLTITGTPTGGTFRLTFNGVETANIAYNANAAAVQSALEAISSIGTGNVLCGGGALPGTPVTITFQGALAAEPQNLITVTNAAFTGGTAPAGAVARTTAGVRAVGAGATPNIRLRHVRIQPQPAPEFLSHRPAGEKLTNHQVVLKEGSEGPMEGLPTYDELGWLLSGIIARPNTATLQASVAYRHVFALDNRVRDGIATFQAEYGDQFARAHRIKGMIVNALDLALRQDGIDLGGSVFGKTLEDGITMNPGAATVQTLTFSGTGTVRLRWKGQETTDLNVATMTNSDVQTALRALPGINGSTQLTVTGGASPFTITFGNGAGGPFLGFPQPLLEIRVISGTPVTSMAMTTRGGYTDYPGQIILPRHVEFFLTPTLSLLSSSKLSNVFSTGLSMANKNSPVFNLDRSETSWFNYAEGSNLDVKFGLVAEANAPAMQFLSQARADTIMFLRILATGGLIGASAFPHRLQIDCPVKVSNFGPFAENQDVYAFEYELAGVQDDATNTNLVVTLDNGVSAY